MAYRLAPHLDVVADLAAGAVPAPSQRATTCGPSTTGSGRRSSGSRSESCTSTSRPSPGPRRFPTAGWPSRSRPVAEPAASCQTPRTWRDPDEPRPCRKRSLTPRSAVRRGSGSTTRCASGSARSVRSGWRPRWPRPPPPQLSWTSLVALVLMWAVLAYLALPRLNRMMAAIYVPDYFIGRTRTSDGLLGGPAEPRGARHGAAAGHRDEPGRADPGRPGHAGDLSRDCPVDADRSQLSPGTGQPADAFCTRSGRRLSAGGGGQPGAASPRPLLAYAAGLAAAGRSARRLARRRDLRPPGRPVAVHLAGHPQDRRRHQRRA